MSRPLVKVVVPIAAGENDRFQRDMMKSLWDQFGRGELFDLAMVRVYQEKGGQISAPIDSDGIPCQDLVFNADGFNHPTPFHQAELGFKHCLDAQFAIYMTANDLMGKYFIASAMERAREIQAKVVYGDVLHCDPDMNPMHMYRSEVEFVPITWYKDGKGQKNVTPDVSLVDTSILKEIPFDAQYLRGSFMVWWYKIWEEYGPRAFSYVNNVAVLYRKHPGMTSNNQDWVKHGLMLAGGWIQMRPWFKYTGSYAHNNNG